MRPTTTSFFTAFLFLALGAGCDGSSSLGIQSSSLTCHAPAGISSQADGAATGCAADPAFQICDPSGCKSPCADSQMPVSCTGPAPSGPLPAPDGALGCTVIPIPTPSDELFYCCPCAR